MLGFALLVLVLVVGLGVVLRMLRGFDVLPGSDRVSGDLVSRADLHRLEEAIGSLEARLDRINDQQRFIERLLEDRPASGALPPSSSPPSRQKEETGSPVDSVLFDLDPEED